MEADFRGGLLWEKTFPEGPDKGPSATTALSICRAPMQRKHPHPPLRGYFSRS